MIEILLIITIVLLLITLFTLIYFIIKQNNKKEEKEVIDESKINLTLENAVNKNLVSISNQFDVLKQSFNNEILKINKVISENLKDNTNENKEHLEKVTASLVKINESSKNLEELNAQIDSLKQVLSVTQKTGRYGEEILENIISQVFGETHGLYEFQKALSNGKKPDAQVHFPSPINTVCIDSKFNYIEYEALYFSKDENETKDLKARFKTEFKKEIDKIKNDYFIKNETSEFIILFMPNDAIFNYIQNDDDLYNSIYVYARKKSVILTSPSSLQPILMTLNVIRINIKTKENIDNILKDLANFKEDVSRLDVRFNKVLDNLNTITNSLNECEKTVKKVVKKTNSLIESSDLVEEES